MKRIPWLLTALFILVYFLYFAYWGLFADFSHDDLMNMWRSLARSYPELAADNLLFWRFSPTYRPFGALVYKVSLDLAGLNLFPLRVFCYLALGLNIFLVYALARRLTGSREVGALAALLHSFHSNFGALYFNNGTLYDIFCFTFTFLGLLLYVRVRQQGRWLNVPQIALFSFLLILALNSKEMALATPLILGAYELIFHGPRAKVSSVATLLLSAGIAAAYYFGRVTGSEGISQSGNYKTSISLGAYLQHTGHYLDELFYRTDWFTAWKTAAFLFALLAVAGLLRSRALALSASLFALGILPMAFIIIRSLQAVYIPVAGLAIYFAVLLVRCRDLVLDFVKCRLGYKSGEAQGWYAVTPSAVFLFALTAHGLMHVHYRLDGLYQAWQKEYGQIRSVMDQLPRLHPTLSKSARILVVQDPFGEFNWASQFIVCLVYRDPYVAMDRLPSMEKKPDAAEIAKYSIRLTYEDGKLRDLSAAEVPLGQ
jgi:hypothetical protein